MARTNFQIDRDCCGMVDQVMTTASTFWKRSALAGPQQSSSLIFNERDFAFEYIDELVFVTMPMPLARPCTGRQRHQVDPEVLEPTCVTQPSPSARRARLIEWTGVSRAFLYGYRRDVDFRHGRELRVANGEVQRRTDSVAD